MATALHRQGRCPPSAWVQDPEFVCWRRARGVKEGPARLFSTLPFRSTAFHAVLRSVFLPVPLPYMPSSPCDPCCPLSSKTPFSPFSTLGLILDISASLALLPALAYGIEVRRRAPKLRPATQIPAGYRKKRRPHSNPTCNLWLAFQPPTPDQPSAFNEHLGLRAPADCADVWARMMSPSPTPGRC